VGEEALPAASIPGLLNKMMLGAELVDGGKRVEVRSGSRSINVCVGIGMHTHVCVCMYIYIYMCVYLNKMMLGAELVDGGKRAEVRSGSIYKSIYIYVGVCKGMHTHTHMCVCVCMYIHICISTR